MSTILQNSLWHSLPASKRQTRGWQERKLQVPVLAAHAAAPVSTGKRKSAGAHPARTSEVRLGKTAEGKWLQPLQFSTKIRKISGKHGAEETECGTAAMRTITAHAFRRRYITCNASARKNESTDSFF